MHNQPANLNGRRVLATDLDGTLIPLSGNDQNRSDLITLSARLEQDDITLIYATGRRIESVVGAIEQFQLPTPDWAICDVGTSIFERTKSGEFRTVDDYQLSLDQIIAPMPIAKLRDQLQSIDGLRLQEEAKQGRFKLSFYADADRIVCLVDRIQQQLDQIGAPYSIVHSVDPFNGEGSIDLLPSEVSKAHAVRWWADRFQLVPDSIVFAGDSGNDLAALTAGYQTIVVANAAPAVAQRTYAEHRAAGWQNRLFFARGDATSGVLEGCSWFGLIEPGNVPGDRLGATPVSCNQTHFRVWAPKRQSVEVDIVDGDVRQRHALQRSEYGYFIGTIPNAGPRATYQYVLDKQQTRPDPASRYQPKGVHGASEIVDPNAFPWTDNEWGGVAKRDLIIYELHIGAFTGQGTFGAAIERIPELIALGVTAVELMPVSQSPGRWNWGYDGVDLFAVRNTYGSPEDFKAFVDACHRGGLAVILDVVYNHLGPEGNYLAEFGPYFSRQHRTPWGEAFNFDGRHSQHVRQFIIDNATHWLEEYHLDGLRLDAVHFMRDNSQPTILDDIRRAVSDFAEGTSRVVHLIAEANVYDRELLTMENGRTPYDAAWCDCLMHSIYAHVLPNLQIAHREYHGPVDLAEVLQRGYVYEFIDGRPVRIASGQRDEQNDAEPSPSHIGSFVTALQTHDGVGNHPHGKRLHQLTCVELQKAAAAIVLLFPSIPLIFMGEESATNAPFPFFADFEDHHLREAVDRGRSREYPQHLWHGAPLPSAPESFYQAKCDDANHGDTDVTQWYRDLIDLRKRGVAEGWLCVTRMNSAYDAELSLFSLHFACDDGREVTVRTRLTGLLGGAPISIAAEGELVLSSEPTVRSEDGRLLLQPNHAVITRLYEAGVEP